MASEEDLYTLSTHLLGKNVDAPAFKPLVKGLKPSVSGNKQVTYYSIPKSGYRLVYSKRRECFIVAEFLVNPSGGKDDSIQSYGGSFFAGVKGTDSISEIQRKVAAPPQERFSIPGESYITYYLEDKKLTFYFDESGSRMVGAMLKLQRSKESNVSRVPLNET